MTSMASARGYIAFFSMWAGIVASLADPLAPETPMISHPRRVLQLMSLSLKSFGSKESGSFPDKPPKIRETVSFSSSNVAGNTPLQVIYLRSRSITESDYFRMCAYALVLLAAVLAYISWVDSDTTDASHESLLMPGDESCTGDRSLQKNRDAIGGSPAVAHAGRAELQRNVREASPKPIFVQPTVISGMGQPSTLASSRPSVPVLPIKSAASPVTLAPSKSPTPRVDCTQFRRTMLSEALEDDPLNTVHLRRTSKGWEAVPREGGGAVSSDAAPLPLDVAVKQNSLWPGESHVGGRIAH